MNFLIILSSRSFMVRAVEQFTIETAGVSGVNDAIFKSPGIDWRGWGRKVLE